MHTRNRTQTAYRTSTLKVTIGMVMVVMDTIVKVTIVMVMIVKATIVMVMRVPVMIGMDMTGMDTIGKDTCTQLTWNESRSGASMSDSRDVKTTAPGRVTGKAPSPA